MSQSTQLKEAAKTLLEDYFDVLLADVPSTEALPERPPVNSAPMAEASEKETVFASDEVAPALESPIEGSMDDQSAQQDGDIGAGASHEVPIDEHDLDEEVGRVHRRQEADTSQAISSNSTSPTGALQGDQPADDEAIDLVEPQAAPESGDNIMALAPDHDWSTTPEILGDRFDCILFRVRELTLAVPMIHLGTIYKLDKDLTSLFGQPKWLLGLYPLSEENSLRVVDTARLVMESKYQQTDTDQLKFMVGLFGSEWALACHEVVGSITLTTDQVKWRSARTSRTWLAGTVIEHMCALLDVQALYKNHLI